MKFKRFIASILIILFSTTFWGCKEEDVTINFLNYGANIDSESLKLFEEKYNIKVNEDTFNDMEEMYTKISSGAVKYDVILVSDNLMNRMIEEDLLQELNKENISSFDQMDETYLNLEMDPGNKYSIPYMFGTIGIIYNTDYVKEEVDSWDVLWDKKYADEIFMFDTYRDTMGVALKRLGYSMNSENKEEIEKAKESLIKQKELVKIYEVDLGTETIQSGETYLNMIWSGEGLTLEDENPNLKFVVPKEGANFWIDSLCIPKESKNVKEAELLINFLSDKEASYRIADEIGYVTPNKEAQKMQSEKVRNNKNAYYSKEVMKSFDMYKDFDKDTKKIYDEAWSEIKSFEK